MNRIFKNYAPFWLPYWLQRLLNWYDETRYPSITLGEDYEGDPDNL